MRVNLKLSHKGLILVGVLLTLELLFVGALSMLLTRAEQEAAKERHSKEIVGITNHIFQLVYDAGTAAADYQMKDGGPPAAARFHTAADKIPQEMARLTALVREDPRYHDLVERVDKNSSSAVRIVTKLMALAESGRMMEALGLAQKVKPVFSKLQDDMFTDLRELMNEQEKIIAEMPAAQARSRQTVKQLLMGGIALNIVFAIALGLFFVRGITRRLELVVDNTNRLVKHEPLNERLTGFDEIAQLDKSFHEMVKALKEVEEMKQQFVAMVSHDLRTPLTSVCGFLELLQHGAYGSLSEQGQKRTQLAERNISRLISLINDLLDMEKLESGRLELIPENIPLEPVVIRSIEAVRVFAEQHKVNLLSDPMDCTVYADGNRLIQVLVNLISNAVKFSPVDGNITISAKPAGDFIEVRVTDQGCGVPKSYHETIFERFRQVRATDATQKGGTGLGLAICKAIVEQHGGRIGVESEDGKGSTFWFSVPVNPPVAQPVAEIQAAKT